MREYYLFHIKQDVYELHRYDGYILYKTLENLYRLKSKNFNYGKSLYEQLCIPFNLSIITAFFNKKYNGYLKQRGNTYLFVNNYIKEQTLVKIGYSRIYIRSNIYLPQALKIFGFYNQKIFVCDFINKDFFWLTRQIKK